MSEMHTITDLPLNNLRFDPKNPRLPFDDPNEEDVLKWMIMDGAILELMMSIGEKGYFPGEALLVVPKENANNQYIVIEGNRRLAATKLLLYPETAPVKKIAVKEASEQAKYRPENIPVIIFPRRDDIIYYLGYRHITGIKTWGALAKAKYLKQLLTTITSGTQVEQHRILAKIIGSRSDVVGRTLAGLAVFEKVADEGFFEIDGLVKEGKIDFSVLTTALQYQKIHAYIGMTDAQDRDLKSLNLDALKDLTTWMFEKNSEGRTRLGESRNLGDLNSVLGHEKARDAFKNGAPLSDAVLLTDVPIKVFQKALAEAKSRLQLARDTLHLVNEFSSPDSEILLEIQKIARNLRTVVDESL